MYKRNIENSIKEALADTPVVLLNGARQTGKSTLAKELAPGIKARYVTLDDATMLAAAASDPAGFIQGFDGPVIIDEAQKAPPLFPAIKIQVDDDRRPGRFLLTGSANVLMLPILSESLAGRMEIVTLHPLSQGELRDRKEDFISGVFSPRLPELKDAEEDDLDIFGKLTWGGFPEILKRPTQRRRRAWWASYITTILQRDIRDLANIEGLTDMPRLLNLLAARVSGLLNVSELSRAVGLPNTTLKRYITLLEMSFLYQPLAAWSTNIGKRLVKSPKINLVDHGMTAHLTGWTDQRLARDPTYRGYLLETFVVGELRKQATWSDTPVDLFHFRTSTGREVDVVIENAPGDIVGIEVKATGSVTERDFAGLRALANVAGPKFFRGVVIYSGEQLVSFGEKYFAMPISALWRMRARR